MRSLTLCALALLVSVPAVAKDLALHQRFTPSSAGAPPFDSIEYLTPTQRIVDGPHARTIIDAKARDVTVIDKDERTYWQASFESLRRQTKPLDERREQSLDPSTGAPVKLAPTGSTETIAGHPCEENLFEGGSPAGSVCVAKGLEAPFDPALWADWSGLGTRLGPLFKISDALGTKRVALRTIVKMSGKTNASVTIQVTSIGEESPPAGMKDMPADYTRATRFSQQH